ncbi:MAG: GHKL domain-containing protein, partial [Firmicutes bacterium]|nr:GHKL domain-containing protein [Bacillota bacterium]
TEFINQIMGEYQERFKSVNLESVVNVPEERVYILADGRSLWRVFDNLLNNICKYSQPNTRVFIEMTVQNDKTIISLKNTSRDLLNIPAADLLERFVRADSSRNSEGSGLGLSIASSLTELQKGTLELFVDGDLFKVVVTFDRVFQA